MGGEKLTKLHVDDDISKASTITANFYTSDEYFDASRELIFSRCWHLAGDASTARIPGQVNPQTILEGFLNEPIIFTRSFDDRMHCLANVCTHRGNILVEGECNSRGLRCRYHGRKFELDGSFVSMPEFEGVQGFPSKKDNLVTVPFDKWGQFVFVSPRPVSPLFAFTGEMEKKLSWLDTSMLKLSPERSRDYLVKCHWALYCENYLEGFHIPFVHESLNSVLDYGNYSTELFLNSSLQTGISKADGHCLSLPQGHEDYGKNVSAYYFWIFPNLMVNVYPWGISFNIVKPLRKDLTKVSFISYVGDEASLSVGSGAELDKVEREDEAIVENVQRGIYSTFYNSGRYSVKRETAVHHFHRLICNYMN